MEILHSHMQGKRALNRLFSSDPRVKSSLRSDSELNEKKVRSQFAVRLYGAIFILAVTLFATSYASYRSLVSVNEQRTLLTEHYSRSLGLSSEMRYSKASEDSLVSSLILSGDPVIFEKVKQARQDFIDLSKKLAEVDTKPDTHARLERISNLKIQLAAHTDAALALRSRGASIEKTFQIIQKRGVPLSNAINSEIQDLRALEQNEFTKARSKIGLSIHALIRDFIWAGFATSAGCALIFIFILFFIRNKQTHDELREQLYEQSKKPLKRGKESSKPFRTI